MDDTADHQSLFGRREPAKHALLHLHDLVEAVQGHLPTLDVD